VQGVQGHPQTFWFGENPGKILENPSKISENFHELPENMSRLPENMSKNGAQHATPNNMESVFLEVTFFGIIFGQVFGNSGKNPSHLQKFACSYTYALTDLHKQLLRLEKIGLEITFSLSYPNGDLN